MGNLAKANEEVVRSAFILGLPRSVSQTLQATLGIEIMALTDMLQISKALLNDGSRNVSCISVNPRSKTGKTIEHTCSFCGKSGHLVEKCFRKNRRCWSCGENDHISSQCIRSQSGNGNGVTRAPVVTPEE